ncbi:hypothetical protein EVAR_7837_1 [Eumeta japonica]|uniref:Uncharacterized protein n=1 Tax=Eumeta variegata TaxID=151549 RepID=A0A4C1TVD3_EUMVA|nr:hypothetical protein EVAR_7837_1 [Eumeta japonica]
MLPTAARRRSRWKGAPSDRVTLIICYRAAAAAAARCESGHTNKYSSADTNIVQPRPSRRHAGRNIAAAPRRPLTAVPISKIETTRAPQLAAGAAGGGRGGEVLDSRVSIHRRLCGTRELTPAAGVIISRIRAGRRTSETTKR